MYVYICLYHTRVVCIVKEVASFLLKLGQLMAMACKERMTEVELGL